jgi:hypothetical protein
MSKLPLIDTACHLCLLGAILGLQLLIVAQVVSGAVVPA